MGTLINVSPTAAIPDGKAAAFDVGEKRVAIFNVGGSFFAIDDTCPHAGASLSEGIVEGDEVECPWHSARFKIKSGAVTSPPSEEGVAKYNVRVTGDAIEVEV